MNTELRALSPDDHLAHRRLMNHAFGRGEVVPPPKPEDTPPDMSGRWGVFEDGRLCAALSIENYLVHWGETVTLAMGGIAGVATFADARGKGYVNQLLRQSLEAMRGAGQTISALYPFAFAFYRRFGWDWVGEKREVILPLAELRSAPEGREVTDVTGDGTARDLLTPGYTRFARRYRGVFTAESHKWDNKLRHQDQRTTHVYRHEPTGAYLLWRYGRDGDQGGVREFVADSPEAYRGLLSLLHYFGTQCKTAYVTVPADSPLWSHVMHWDLSTKIEPVFMGRVVDFAAAMANRDATPELPNGALTLALKDEHAPWNDGLWHLGVEEGRLSVTAQVGGAGEPGVSLDIQALSQAFWGYPSLTDLRRAGRVHVASEDAFALLARLLPPAPVYTLDDF